MTKVLRAQALIRLGDIESAESILNCASEKNSQYPSTYAAMASLSLASEPAHVKTAAQYASMAVTLLRRVLSNDKIYSKEAIMLWKAIKAKNKKK